MADPLLTPLELRALDQIGEVGSTLFAVVREAGGFDPDMAEVADKVHQLQALVMSNAAARAYPDRFRLLGQTKQKTPESATG
jgi:hypothetical protein